MIQQQDIKSNNEMARDLYQVKEEPFAFSNQ